MKNLALYIDLAFCLIVLPIMVALSPIERWVHNFTAYMTLAGAWLYFVYIINRTFTIPFLFGSRNKKIYGAIMILVSIIVTFTLSGIELYIPKPSIHDEGIVRRLPQILQYQQALWTLFMIVEAFSFAVGLLVQTNIQKARLRAAEAERDKAEIELYKAQIKPHFMFNTLNSLYGLFLTENNNALPSLEKFISMMRYIHTSSNRDLVPLSEEAEYIREYVEVQSLRLNEMTKVVLNIDIDNDSLMIPPMLLVTFVENCFKHGVSPVQKSCIHIGLSEDEGNLSFATSNRIFPVKRIGEHMGIENCRKRLELLYPGLYELSIINDNDIYKVSLQIKLKS
ncbi:MULTISPECIES: histidine kinase [Bacteroidales]|jgi:LytS/YehU family sensor histidine kinase|uniref:sensor histidine kinase n=1 Tax=Bacteroidales TaxID=171549 RepID=UPI002585B30F|nr:MULTISPECIES: histidine kinase [Bacteroidales]